MSSLVSSYCYRISAARGGAMDTSLGAALLAIAECQSPPMATDRVKLNKNIKSAKGLAGTMLKRMCLHLNWSEPRIRGIAQ
jgi:hypothetical protein